jgi:hypothetical protein
MAKLTDDQLAKRAATKRNNRLRKSMPLFAPLLTEAGPMADWLTTPGVQKERIQQQHAEFKKTWERWEKGDAEFKARGDERRAILAKHIEAETLVGLDQHYIKLFANYEPAFWADYWWGKLVEHVPEIAQARCPNKHLHNEFSRSHDCCPTCSKPLSPAPVPDGPVVKQLQLAL